MLALLGICPSLGKFLSTFLLESQEKIKFGGSWFGGPRTSPPQLQTTSCIHVPCIFFFFNRMCSIFRNRYFWVRFRISAPKDKIMAAGERGLLKKMVITTRPSMLDTHQMRVSHNSRHHSIRANLTCIL